MSLWHPGPRRPLHPAHRRLLFQRRRPASRAPPLVPHRARLVRRLATYGRYSGGSFSLGWPFLTPPRTKSESLTRRHALPRGAVEDDQAVLPLGVAKTKRRPGEHQDASFASGGVEEA